MTLRSYLVKFNDDPEREVFLEDYEAVYAEGWDANIFSMKFLHKAIAETNYEDVYKVFRIVAEFIRPVSFEELKDEIMQEDNEVYTKLDLGDGSYKKLNLKYNPDTYEIDNDED